MKGFKPLGETCALHDYAELLSVLNRLGAFSPSQKADLCTENEFAMGNCGRACVDGCMASTFFPYLADNTPHTRHPEVPLLADIPKDSIAN